MRTMFASLMLIGFGAATPLAHAALEVESSGFSLGLTDGYYPDLLGFDMQVLSDNGSTVQIGLHGAGPMINPVHAMATSYDHGNGDYGWTQLGGTVKQGYRITSITISGVLSGSLNVGQPDIECSENCTSHAGIATNLGGITLNATSNGNVLSATSELENVTSSQLLSTALTASLGGDFKLDIYSILDVYTRAAQYSIYHNINNEIDWTEEVFWTSEGSIALSDLTLTVQLAPVPEPGTYAMLLAGLGLVGFASRRRR